MRYAASDFMFIGGSKKMSPYRPRGFCESRVCLAISSRALRCLLTILLTAGVISASQTDASRAPSRRPLRVLFIGNSYTYFNNLPRVLEQLALSAGTPMETRMVVEGGATLQDHWEKGDALKAVRESPWDYVILQDQSTLGAYIVNGHSQVADPDYFHRFARLFDQEIKKSGAKTVFYLTWASKDAPAREQAALNYAYMAIARELKGSVAPVGVVWQEVRREDPRLELYVEDKSHPRGAGSYLAACVLYAAIYGKSPVGLPSQVNGNPVDDDGNVDTKKRVTLVSLSPSDAKLIQRAAWETRRKMRASGGYLSAPKPPPPPDLPSLPAGRKPTIKDLEGLWVGRLNFYPVPWPSKMELTLRRDGGELRAELRIRFEGHPEADKSPQITNLQLTATGISFLDAKGISGAPMRYTAAFTGSALSGIAEVKVEGQPVHAIGAWELRRQD